ncbi:MAG: hypothetical protein AMXMBFR13_37860 [Phycisphaerae bacterium]|jgi:hypothetical protein
MNLFLAGAVAMACCTVALFFLRFFKQTGDRFFLIFSLAFWVLAINRLALTMTERGDEIRLYLYIVRFVAFMLIILAIVDKNRIRRGSSSSPLGSSSGTTTPMGDSPPPAQRHVPE